mmetsp:Transcript_12102/g.27621  ORF Transcript_12102/g.27621 Transcript_12102/m.27621 type:complete len:220 (-) Transcript_12102:1533-2192(-)
MKSRKRTSRGSLFGKQRVSGVPSDVLLSGGVKPSDDASLSTSVESSSRNPSLGLESSHWDSVPSSCANKKIGLQSIIGEVKALRVSGARDTEAGSSKDSAGKEPRVLKGGEENQPKPPMKKRSAWMLYSDSTRVELAGSNPEMSATEVTRVVGLRFKALSLEERVSWQMKAEEDEERYKKELAEYRKKVGPADVGPRSDVTLGDLIKQSKKAGPWYSVV